MSFERYSLKYPKVDPEVMKQEVIPNNIGLTQE